ncbi:hypothetical protein VM1G_09051 [Cytospora mali]|uniref:PD-(D/E)XK nuclease-like domain-containing protein n=1 Tax=Cytospora mali TaxID=578113 RepID=A0A194WB99_CYTMA|nr:hypothetical protein VM1G_09051 [Valsa mali]
MSEANSWLQSLVLDWLDRTELEPAKFAPSTKNPAIAIAIAMPPSPPLSIARHRSQSPTKKRKMSNTYVDEYGSDDDVEDAPIDMTPQPKLKMPTALVYRGPPSLSKHSSCPSASVPSSDNISASVKRKTASSRARSTSPVTPVHFNKLGEGEAAVLQLPEDVRSLYDRIYALANKEGIIPAEIRTEMTRILGATRTKDYYFKPSSSRPPLLLDPLTELQILQSLRMAGDRCDRYGRYESAWNTSIYGPLLSCALDGYSGYVEHENLTSVAMDPAFAPQFPLSQPQLQQSLQPSQAETKRVDFALVLSADPWIPWEHRGVVEQYNSGLSFRAQSPYLTQALHEAILLQPQDKQFINQTAYTAIFDRPIAVSIETKVSGTSEDGRIQLSTWTAAAHRRIKEFFIYTASVLGQEVMPINIITLPVILVEKHHWKLMFICDREGSLEILDGLDIGNTESLIGMYSLVEVLRALADWTQDVFAGWWEDRLAEVMS